MEKRRERHEEQKKSGCAGAEDVYKRQNVFSTYATTYLVFIVLIIVWFVFYKTRYGLRLRACGEHPETCDTLGINCLLYTSYRLQH